MHLLVAAVTALIVTFPLIAIAQKGTTKGVVVLNFPDPQNVTGAVEVTNLPDVQDVNIVNGSTGSCEVKRVRLIGFTSTTYTGNLGGILGSTRKCQVEFPASRMCALDEIIKTTNLPAQIPEFAWMEPVSGSCGGDLIIDGQDVATRQWTCDLVETPCRFNMSSGVSLESTGTVGVPRLCSAEQPIACCAPMP